MTDTRKAQLEIGVNAAPAEEGFKRVERAGKGMADAVGKLGAEASKGVDSIGKGADASAQKLDKATSSIIASVQRTTAAMQAGEKGTAKYFEELANQRGVNADVLKPYLDGLRAVEMAQGKVGVSAKQTAAAMRGVPAQFTDIITSLQGGQAPLTVLLQQGGQLKDMFGGVGNAAKSLGGYVAGLVNPFTVAAAAGGVLALAYAQGSKEADEFRKALLLSGNAAGASVGQLSALAESIGSGFGKNVGQAAAALTVLAASGGVGRASLKDFATTAIDAEKAFGIAAKDIAKNFADLAKDPLGASVKLNESMNYLTESTYKQIKAAQDLGQESKAAALAQDAYNSALKGRSAEVLQSAGTIEKAWAGIKSAATGAWDAMLGVGRPVTVASQIGLAQKNLEAAIEKRKSVSNDSAFAPALDKEIAKLKEQTGYLNEIDRLQKRAGDSAAEQTRQTKARIEADKEGLKYLSEQQKMQRDIAQQVATLRAAKASEAEIEQRIAQIKSSYVKKDASTGGENEVASIRAKIRATTEYIDRLKDLGLETPKLTEAEQQSLKIQEELRGSITGTARAMKEKALIQANELIALEKTAQATELWRERIKKSEADYKSLVAAMGKSADSINSQAASQEAANAVFGKGTTAVQELTLATLKHQMAEAQSSDRFTPEYIASLQAKIDAQERFVKALRASDYKTLNAGLDEWLRSSQEAGKLYADEARLASLTSLERAKVVAQRQVELQLAKEISKIDQSNLGDPEKEALRQKARDAATIASAAATSKAVQDEWTKVADQINSSLTDALMRGFESGKGFAQTLKDTVVNMFKTMVLRPVVSAIINPITGGLSALFGGTSAATAAQLSLGGAAGGSGGLLGGVSSLKSLYDIATGSFTAGISSAYGAFAGSSVGQALGLSSQVAGPVALGGSAPVALTSAGQTLGVAAGYAGGALAGIGIGNMISGQYSAFGNKNVATVGGTAIGAIFGGPIGAAIGGAIGGVINRAFGMGPKTTTDTGITGQFSTTGASIQNFENWAQKGGWFRSDKSGTNYSAISSEFDGFLDTSLKAITSATKGYASIIGLNADVVDGITKSINISLNGLDAAGREKAIATALTGFGDTLAEQLLGTFEEVITQTGSFFRKRTTTTTNWIAGPFVRAGETASQALSRLANSLVGVNAVMDTLSQTAFKATVAGADMASQLVDVFGGLESLQKATGTYYDAFYSDAERIAKATQNMSNALTLLGLQTPVTLAAFRDLVEAQDLTTVAGRQTYAALIALAPSFAEITNSTSDMLKSLSADVTGFFEGVASSVASARQSVAESVVTLTQKPGAKDYDAIKSAISAATPSAASYGPVDAALKAQASATAQASAQGVLAGSAQAKSDAAKLVATAASKELAQLEELKAQRQASYASQKAGIEAVQANWNAWSYGVRYKVSNESIPALNRLGAEIAAMGGTIDAAAKKSAEANSLYAQASSELAVQNSAYAVFVDLQKKAVAASQTAREVYASQVRQYVIDASKSVEKLKDLREQTTAYHDAQKALADSMLASASNLRQAAYNSRVGQLTGAQSLAERGRSFDQNYILALSTSGAMQAAYADKLTAALPTLTESLKSTASSRADWVRATSDLYSKSDAIAKQLEASAPKNYQAETLDLLGQIDATLANIDAAASSAEKIISDAIYATGDKNLTGLRAIVAALRGETVPAFAGGGYHRGGIRLVGENGPELEVTGASNILNASATASILSGSGQGNAIAELRAMREELAALRAETRSTAVSSDKTAKILDRVTQGTDTILVTNA